MTEAPLAATRETLKTPRAAGVAGILFAVLYSSSIVLVRLSVPPDLADHGVWLRERAGSVALALSLVPFAGIAFLWFMGVVRDRIGLLEGQFLSTVFFGSGLLFVAMTFVSAALAGGLLSIHAAEAGQLIDSGLYTLLRAVVLRITSAYAVKMAGVFMISLATIALRTAVMPRVLTLATLRAGVRPPAQHRHEPLGRVDLSCVGVRGQRPHPRVEPAPRIRDLMRGFLAAACLAVTPLVWTPAVARAQDPAPTESAPDVATEFSDPLTTLPQLFLNDAFTPESYGTAANLNRLTARLIVPRVPSSSLLPFVQLIRPSFSLVTVPSGKGSGTHTAFGDTQLFDLGVLPWPDRKSGLMMGVGPVFVFPTATDEDAGQGAWQVGPAFAAIYKGIPGLLLGCLVQNPISFAYTGAGRDPVSTLLLQPVVMAYLGKGFYVKSADSTWSLGWRDGTARIIPVSLGLGYVMLRDGWPPLNVFASGEWTVYRENAPVAPQTTLRLGVTVAFPQWRPW